MFALELSDFNCTHDCATKPLHSPSAHRTLCFMWNLDITPSDRSLFTSISPLELTITNLNFLKFLKLPCAPVHVHHSESYSLSFTPANLKPQISLFVHFTTSLFHERRWSHSQRKKHPPSASQNFPRASSTLSSPSTTLPEKEFYLFPKSLSLHL